jgi:integrase
MPTFLVPHLEEQIAGRAADDFVFTSPNGAPLRRANFRKRVWLPALRKAGLVGLRFHDLRHTHVALSIAAGAEILALTRRLGHTRVAFTLDRYGHLLPGADAAIAEGLDRLHRQASNA